VDFFSSLNDLTHPHEAISIGNEFPYARGENESMTIKEL
jgi:hypothetical protein